MSDLKKVKKRIYENFEDNMLHILESLECEYITYRSNRYECQLPERFESDNKRSVQVKDSEHLSASIRSRSLSGDIFNLVSFILFDDFELYDGNNLFQSKIFICNLFDWNDLASGLDTEFEEEVICEADNSWLHKVKSKRGKKVILNKSNEVLVEEKAKSWFFDYPHKMFTDDGILPSTQIEFGVMIDLESQRIVFPCHNKDGELIGYKGRYFGKNELIQRDFKYNYVISFNKSIELFNWHRAFNHIIDCGEVIVFEAEKSCMKCWQYGIKNTLAIGGSELSMYQLYLLKSLNVNIVFAYDNGFSISVIDKYKPMLKSRLVSYIEDDKGLLGEKDSPIDKGIEIFLELMKSKKKIT